MRICLLHQHVNENHTVRQTSRANKCKCKLQDRYNLTGVAEALWQEKRYNLERENGKGKVKLKTLMQTQSYKTQIQLKEV